MGSCAQGWFHTKWSKECSVECGRGHYVRQVYCSAADGSPLAEHKCGGKDSKPKEKKKCKSSKPCGGLWFAGPWSKCNSTCGSDAYREREVLCVKRHGKRLNHVVKGHNCEKEKKPQSREWCGPLATCKPQWYMTAWSECSKSCGTGVRTREAKCLDSTLTASPDCDKSHKPNRRQSCNKQPCPDGFAEFSETPAASQNEALQMDGSSAASKVDDVSECSDQQSSSWCYMASQARLCTIPYYKDMCCLTCRKMLPKPH
ncbi:thrombospondin type-1 domain-containing protein 4 [Aplysia californica]|uniref:Thrombospondin type-1 domain-containing protein 4 n=1 Tax=Aplysia californica TaxID=6500 RepID=A0ABM1A3R5_APLCA|nr:thrombospondin type-1 domain-containing protein 4 [Aplysia californica]